MYPWLVTLTLVRVTLRARVEFRFKAWPGFGCISVGIRGLGSVLAVLDVPKAVGAPVVVGELVAVWRPALEFEVHPVMGYFWRGNMVGIRVAFLGR